MPDVSQTITVYPTALEIAKGYDGPLRGAPEPRVILAAYWVERRDVRLLGREVYRFDTRGPFPKTETPRSSPGIAVGLTTRVPGCFVFLGIAVEEDSGRGVQTLYAGLEDARNVQLWCPSSASPTPNGLVGYASGDQKASTPAQVELMFASDHAAQLAEGDDWVGSVAWALPAKGAAHAEFRLPFGSAKAPNQWTAFVTVARR